MKQPELSVLRERTSEKWRRYPDNVLPLFVAEMDFELAPAIAAALHKSIDRSDTGYAWPQRFAETFRDYALRAFEWEVAPENVFLINDVRGAIFECLRALTAHDSRVILLTPAYPPFFEVIEDAGRNAVHVPLMADRKWQIDFDALERACSQGAGALLLCHPHNPVGTVLSRETLEILAALAQRYGVTVISDEIHAQLVYDDARHVPFAAVAGPLGVDSVTLMSASKAWNIAGLKCAQMIAGTPRVQAALSKLPKDVGDRLGQFGLIATVAAYTEGQAWLDDVMVTLDRNRMLVAELVAQHLPDVTYQIPKATYLAWLDFRATPVATDPATFFLTSARVALADGRTFGARGEGYARLNFATSPAIIEEAMMRMGRAMKRPSR